MAKEPATLRLFVGVYPPPDVTDRLLAMLPPLRLAAHRLTPADQAHVTIQFIGPTDLRELDRVRESIHRAVSGVAEFDLHVERLITLPRRGRVRLLAAVLDEPPGLLEIQRRLAVRLARRVRAGPGDRYLPHITLCRFKSASDRLDRAVEVDISFRVVEVRLMKSVLHPQGARHALVNAFALT